MSFLSSLNVSGSGLTAQKLRMDVISQNIANAHVTRGPDGAAYRRKMVVLNTMEGQGGFRAALDKASDTAVKGVRVQQIVEDPSPLVPVYDPDHPDANEEGYVMLPNVSTIQEMIDMLSVSRAFEANVTAFNATKSMALKALEIGRR